MMTMNRENQLMIIEEDFYEVWQDEGRNTFQVRAGRFQDRDAFLREAEAAGWKRG